MTTDHPKCPKHKRSMVRYATHEAPFYVCFAPGCDFFKWGDSIGVILVPPDPDALEDE